MSKNPRNVKVVALLPAQKPSNMELLERLVRERVDEILASNKDLLMRPFFDTARVTVEIRRLQTMAEIRKWPKYFEFHGCLICRTKEVPHTALGMCHACYTRTFKRLRAILAEDARTQEKIETAKFARDLELLARRSLTYTVNRLPAKGETDK